MPSSFHLSQKKYLMSFGPFCHFKYLIRLHSVQDKQQSFPTVMMVSKTLTHTHTTAQHTAWQTVNDDGTLLIHIHFLETQHKQQDDIICHCCHGHGHGRCRIHC